MPEPKTIFDRYAIYGVVMSILSEIEVGIDKKEALDCLAEIKKDFSDRLLSDEVLTKEDLHNLSNHLPLLKLKL
ncbi:MAG: hypothetical protein AABY22_08210 [Nanoarchaeota archaeon]